MFSHFVLAVLCILFEPSVCGLVDNDCLVDNVAVQENFDLNKFLGKWYEHKWYTTTVIPPAGIFVDYIQYYVQTSSGNVTIYTNWRYNVSQRCDFDYEVLQQTSTPAKMTRIKKSGNSSSYWIIDTDYTNYALVYGCAKVSTSGTCDDARGWVWGRGKQPPSIEAAKEQAFYNNICLKQSDFLSVEHSKECDVPKDYKMSADQNCNINSQRVQENFNKEKFAGLWYQMIWIPSDMSLASSALSNFMNEFILDSQGNYAVYVRGRGRQCIYNENKLTKKGTPGDYIYSGKIAGNAISHTLWIIETDYDNYAIEYDCGNIANDTCVKGGLAVWSRRPSLSPPLMSRANTVIQELCLNPVAGIHTPQDNTCPPQSSVMSCPINGGKVPLCVSCLYYIGLVVLCLLISQGYRL